MAILFTSFLFMSVYALAAISTAQIKFASALSTRGVLFGSSCVQRMIRAEQVMSSQSSSIISSSSADNSNDNNNLILILAGPTGSGKSDVAAQLRSDNNKDMMVISADSVQAYRGVQIGANKPTRDELQETPHLLLDMASHDEPYNAAEWRRDALYCIQELLQTQQKQENDDSAETIEATSEERRKAMDEIIAAASRENESKNTIPLVVGGTMMYIQWLLHGSPDAMRPTSKAVQQARDEISKFQQDNNDWDGAVKHVESMGEAFASRITTLSGQDWYRLRRILEVAYTVRQSEQESNNKSRKRSLEESLYSGQREGALQDVFPTSDIRCFFLCPTDRMHHSTLVDKRCEAMILGGLLEETTELFCNDELPEMASRAIGYRQTLDYLQRSDFTPNDAEALELYLEHFCTATRRYAKKQMQWFRKEDDFLFVPIDTANKDKATRVQEAAALITNVCQLTRDQYKQELLCSTDNNVFARTKQANEDQGKGMKFYQYKSDRIVKGTPEFDDVLKRADECTRRIQDKKKDASK